MQDDQTGSVAQGDHTGSVAGQQPAQQQPQQREEQAGDVHATLYDIDLRNIRLGSGMPALRHSAQLFLDRNGLTDVLRRPEGCTIEALVVDPLACCNSNDDVRSLRGRPWWPRAVQMRSLLADRIFTLAHWAVLSEDDRGDVPAIRDMLDTQLAAQQQAAAVIGGETTELIWQHKYEAERRASVAIEELLKYLGIVRLLAAEARIRAEGALPAATNMRTQATATTEAAQPRQQVAGDRYGQECRQLLSDFGGRALYESVYKATWGALQYSTHATDNGRIVYAEGETALPVTLNDQGIEVAEDDTMYAAQHANGIAMLTLYSQRGWPTSWAFSLSRAENSPVNVPVPQQAQQSRDPAVIDDAEHRKLLYVRYEVQRAWRNVACVYNEHNSDARLSTLPLGHVPPATTPTQRTGDTPAGLFVLGTPGIGKTMSGNYMVYRLLHDVNAPPCIAFAVGRCVFVFDKRRRMVSCYDRDYFNRDRFRESQADTCVYIHDCAAGGYNLGQVSLPAEALMLVLSSPNVANVKDIDNKGDKFQHGRYVVVNSWSYRELCCVAPHFDVDLDTLRERVVNVGPLPRHVYDKTTFDNRMRNVIRAVGVNAEKLQGLSYDAAKRSIKYGKGDENPRNTLYDMYRVRSDENQQDDNVPTLSDEWQFRLFAEKIPSMLLSKIMCQHIHNIHKILDAIGYLSTSTASYEMYVKVAITLRLFWRGVHTTRAVDDSARFHRCLRPGTELPFEPAVVPLTAAAIQHWTQRAPDMLNVRAVGKDEATIAFGASDTAVVYMPEGTAFALIDAFLLVRESAAKVHFVGIQATTAEVHPVTRSQLEYFVKDMPELCIAVDPPQTQANEPQPQQVTTAQPAAQTTTSAQATVAGGKGDAAAALLAKLGRMRASIATWSVVYVGARLRDILTFAVKPDPPQKRKEALAATGAQRQTDTHSDVPQPRARRAASSTSTAHVGITAQPQTDPGNAAETAQQAQVHANDTADPYIAFWNNVTRYIYKASKQHLNKVRNDYLGFVAEEGR